MKLLNPTDDQLNAAFAEHVAGWKLWAGCRDQWTDGKKDCGKARFTQSADAVLPWLEKRTWSKEESGQVWVSNGAESHGAGNDIDGSGIDFPRAAVIALLRAHGVGVEFTAS